MLKRERHAFILHQVHLHNKVLCTDLSTAMQVSDDTIRRDLQELADEGKLIKVHGGALSTAFYKGTASEEETYSFQQKKIIAGKAAALIQNGMFVLTGGGTTVVEVARSLPPQLQATFISGSLPALLEYSNHPGIEVIAIGDKISKSSKITVGADAIAQIKKLHCDLCLLGINAINIQNGITDNDWEVVQVKKAMLAAARKTVCLTIAEKLNSVQPIQLCALNEIDILITELAPDHPMLQPYVEAGIRVL